MASQEFIRCTLCRDYLMGKTEGYGGAPGKKIKLDAVRGEYLCNHCESNLCAKNSQTSLCQQIRKLRYGTQNEEDKRLLKELEDQMHELNMPKRSEKSVDEQLAELELQAEQELETEKVLAKPMMLGKAPRAVQSPRPLGTMRKVSNVQPVPIVASSPKKEGGLLSKLKGVFKSDKKKKEKTYY
jgi:hypothetical protein